MEFQRSLSLLFLVVFSTFLSSGEAYRFYVGGNNGWIVNPSENYNHWAERNRFQINDTLFFKYKRGSDSVLVVSKEDYENCYTKNPIKKLDNGDSEFKFERSGLFYFISGKDGNCEKGQKLIVVVLALRSPPPPPPSPATPASSPLPAAPEPSMAAPPSTPPSSQAPSSGSPLSPSPVSGRPGSSPTPSSQSPSSTTEPTSTPSESTLSPPPSGSSMLTVIPSATLVLTITAVTVMVWTSS